MSLKPCATFYQLLDDGKINEKTKTTQEQNFLDNSLCEQQLIYWTTFELLKFYRLFTKHRIPTFSLRRPIFIDVVLKEAKYKFVCQHLPKAALTQLKKVDFPFRLKNTLFLIRPKDQLIRVQTNDFQKQDVADLGPLLNAIEERMKKEVNKFSPVIYTGMTN